MRFGKILLLLGMFFVTAVSAPLMAQSDNQPQGEGASLVTGDVIKTVNQAIAKILLTILTDDKLVEHLSIAIDEDTADFANDNIKITAAVNVQPALLANQPNMVKGLEASLWINSNKEQDSLHAGFGLSVQTQSMGYIDHYLKAVRKDSEERAGEEFATADEVAVAQAFVAAHKVSAPIDSVDKLVQLVAIFGLYAKANLTKVLTTRQTQLAAESDEVKTRKLQRKIDDMKTGLEIIDAIRVSKEDIAGEATLVADFREVVEVWRKASDDLGDELSLQNMVIKISQSQASLEILATIEDKDEYYSKIKPEIAMFLMGVAMMQEDEIQSITYIAKAMYDGYKESFLRSLEGGEQDADIIIEPTDLLQ